MADFCVFLPLLLIVLFVLYLQFKIFKVKVEQGHFKRKISLIVWFIPFYLMFHLVYLVSMEAYYTFIDCSKQLKELKGKIKDTFDDINSKNKENI